MKHQSLLKREMGSLAQYPYPINWHCTYHIQSQIAHYKLSYSACLLQQMVQLTIIELERESGFVLSIPPFCVRVQCVFSEFGFPKSLVGEHEMIGMMGFVGKTTLSHELQPSLHQSWSLTTAHVAVDQCAGGAANSIVCTRNNFGSPKNVVGLKLDQLYWWLWPCPKAFMHSKKAKKENKTNSTHDY